MELRDQPEPSIKKPGEALLKIESVGVCGSDVHYYSSGRIGSQVVEYPYRVGHECSATVIETGENVTRVKEGDLVAVDPAVSCGSCDQCRCGRENTCRDLSFLGTPGQGEGCLCEYIVMPEQSLFSAPSALDAEKACLVEPLSIGAYSVNRSIPMKEARIGILGSGPIGLSVLMSALDHGAAKAYVTDLLDYRLKAARQIGAAWTGNPGKADVVKEVSSLEPLLLDAVFECCGRQEALDQAVEMLKPGGKLVVVGIPEEDRVSFCIDSIRRKELSIQNIRRQNGCVAEAIDLINRRRNDADLMITHRYPLEEAKAAFDLVKGYENGVIKAVISP